jgi:ADP-heptose:LPS heptosyltransferase
MRIAVSNPDNIGDFVLRQPMLAALEADGHELLLVVRDFVAPLAMELFPGARVVVCAGDPYRREFTLGTPLGRKMIADIREFAPELVVVAAFQHTQMEEDLARALPDADFVGFRGHLFQARLESVAVSGIAFRMQVDVAVDAPELEKNERLCAAVLGRRVELGAPRMRATEQGLAVARQRVKAAGLEGQRFWAVCAGDIADKSVKNWTREQWAEFGRSLLARQDVNLLFIGGTSEHEATVEIQDRMGEAGYRTATLTGLPNSLETLAGILELAEGYIGKDTGPMHMAAALGKPVLAVFGGGHWPRFVPAGERGAAFTVAVPCSGCNWECPLERSHCVKDIPVRTLVEAAEQLVEGQAGAFEVRVLEPQPVLAAAILRETVEAARRDRQRLAAERINFAQWHDDRLREISQLQAQLRDALQGEREGRLSEAQREIHAMLAEEWDQSQPATTRAEWLEAQLRRALTLLRKAEALEERAKELEFECRLQRAKGQEYVEARERAERKLEGFRKRIGRRVLEARGQVEAIARERSALQEKLAEVTMRLNAVEGRYEGRMADLELELRRRDEELASALQLIPDLRDELNAAAAELRERETQIQEMAAHLAAKAVGGDLLPLRILRRLRSL